MDTPRTVYKVTQAMPGSEVAAEMAAALAAISMLFKNGDSAYAKTALETAEKAFAFAEQFKGKYTDSHKDICEFYCSHSGYNVSFTHF